VLGKEHSYQVIEDALDSIPGLEILRLDGPLFFANALRFRNEVSAFRQHPTQCHSRQSSCQFWD
jgi:MFS superfamily sulfate permease-like transporter